ncbi:hypothetical protein [Xanthocytophaga agilis]|uniref:Uncharacterized protein n=1 Tax=Xanthocytophaga agilis TaxID=3048010 RepID=A0AAE3RBU2_9BACT|nr:hypothetical protein [Xanthocytophaga agilis]MDJ1505344.1 hypothetical protein [Xanthocytophaga agilis]
MYWKRILLFLLFSQYGFSTSLHTKQRFEVAYYTSVNAPGQKLIVVFPQEGAGFFLLEENQHVHLLKTDDEAHWQNQKIPLQDSLFATLAWKGISSTPSGIGIYNILTLYKKDKTSLVFQRTESPKAFRSPASAYSYGNDTVYGYISFKKTDAVHYDFTTDIKTGNSEGMGCNTAGTLFFKKGIGYFEDILFENSLGACQAIFWFGDKTLQVFMLSDAYFCVCLPDASLTGVYQQE